MLRTLLGRRTLRSRNHTKRTASKHARFTVTGERAGSFTKPLPNQVKAKRRAHRKAVKKQRQGRS